MRKFVKQNLLNLTNTLSEAHKSISLFISNKDNENACSLLADCQNCTESIYDTIEESEGASAPTLSLLSEYHEALYILYQHISSKITNTIPDTSLIDNLLTQINKSVSEEIPVIFEIVFLPYNASMWDSFDSIYDAAIEDPRCNVKVIPIPYYDKNPDGSFATFHYEGDLYPKHIEITDYNEYDLEQNRPDVIYIHNPYDAANTVTSVDPAYYSKVLKKYTDMLVYIPYHISGIANNYESVINNIVPAFFYVDKIIVQSKSMYEYLKYGGISSNRLLALGNPKIDYIINKLETTEIPESWDFISYHKKILLVNTTVSRAIASTDWIDDMYNLISITKDRNIHIVWRPHPLLNATIKRYHPEALEKYEMLLNTINNTDYFSTDLTTSVFPSIKCSDALVSDQSSIVFQFIPTSKPVLMTQRSSEEINNDVICFNFFSNYFTEDGMSIDTFINMISSETDPKKNERINAFISSIENPDGTCGQKIHKSVIDILK